MGVGARNYRERRDREEREKAEAADEAARVAARKEQTRAATEARQANRQARKVDSSKAADWLIHETGQVAPLSAQDRARVIRTLSSMPLPPTG